MRKEEKWIEQLKDREEQAFEQLYNDYAPMLFGIILRIVDNQADAENLLQDCFVKIWMNIAQFDPQKGWLATWMINIARNCAIDFMRSGYFSLRRKIHWEDPLVSGESRLVTRSLNEETIGLRQLLEKLPPACREVIEWMYFDGMSQSEIADTFGIPLGTVKTRTRAALKALRTIFNL